MINSFKKVAEVINSKKKVEKLKFILFLNFINFFLEIATIISIPIFASLLIDKNYLIERYEIDFNYLFYGFDPIIVIGIIIILLFILKNCFLVFLIYKQTNLIKDIKVTISEKIFHYYLLGSYQNHLSRSPSELTRDTTYSVQSFGYYIFHFIVLFREIFATFFIVLLLLYIKPIIVILSGVFLFGLSFLFIKKFKKTIETKASENQNLNNIFTKFVHNTFSSIKDVKILKKELEVLKNFKSQIYKFEDNLFFFQTLEKLPKVILEIFSVAFILILCVTIFSVIENQTEQFALLSLFVVAIIRMLPSITAINASINYLRIFEPSLNTLRSEYKKNIDLNENIKKINFKEIYKNEIDTRKDLIVVEDLNFGYMENYLNLKNLNLKISEGEMNCIVGVTGSGKSTLFNTMLGLLKPQKGNIFYKNKNIFNNLSHWYDEISLVSQEPYLFESTIENNITFNVSDDLVDNFKLQKAIKITELSETISKLPQGLKTLVSNHGINLSGGEKQRIALARAIYKDSSIFFLDEFTNAIDEKTEIKIIDNLKKLNDKTFVIISHKQTTIMRCDKIWKLEKGSIQPVEKNEIFR